MDKDEALKAIAENVASVKSGLSAHARHWAARYNGSVYLVGSTLTNPTPRDCDVRIIVDDHEFAARYGHALHRVEIAPGHPYHTRRPEIASAMLVDWSNDGPTQRWVDDIAKFSAHLCRQLRLNMDIQIWPDSYWREPYPPPILLAAPSPRWFFHD